MWPKILVFGLVASAALGPRAVAAIHCYVCDASDTENPFQCGEWFERYDTPDLQPQNCSNVHEARFCVKHVGRFEGGIGAKRFCSSKDLGNYCDYVRNKGDRMDYRSCIYTCDSDGCNAGPRALGPARPLLLLLCLFLLPLLGGPLASSPWLRWARPRGLF